MTRGVAAILAALGIAWAASAQERLGTVHFPVSCDPGVQPEFDGAVALLHSFWFDAAIRAFSAVGQVDPGCGMAFWGIAMTLSHAPPEPAILAHAWGVVERAKGAGAGTARESDSIAALEVFYKDWETRDPRTRALAFEQAFRSLHGAARAAELMGSWDAARSYFARAFLGNEGGRPSASPEAPTSVGGRP